MRLTGAPRRAARELRRITLGRRGPRWNIPSEMSVDAFFRALGDAGVDYCILRWFDDLPDVEPGEDIDLLVADDSLPALHRILGSQRLPLRTTTLDVYSASGLPRSDHLGVAYYPPRLARQILDSGQLVDGTFRVPDPQMHFRSLAYHAVVRKGPASGVPLATGGDVTRSDHDYFDVLERLAPADGHDGPITLEALAAHLRSVDWLPAHDTVDRFRSSRPWLDRLFERHAAELRLPDGVIVYLIREAAVERGIDDEIVRQLDRLGMEIVHDSRLDDHQMTEAANDLRGGVWHQGPFPVSGGRPCRIIVAADPFHPFRDDAARGKKPLGTRAKERARQVVMADIPRGERFNPIHSTDDSTQSADYIELLLPGEIGAIVAQLDALAECRRRPSEDAELINTTMRRAVVWRTSVAGQAAITKTFRPGARAHLERERSAHRLLVDRHEPPELLGNEGPSIVRTMIDHEPPDPWRPLSMDLIDQLVRFAEVLNERGLVLLDLSPGNAIADRTGRLRVIDFEFLFEHQPQHRRVGSSPTVRGVGSGWALDSPLFASRDGRSTARAFSFAATGMPRAVTLSRRSGLRRAVRVGLRPIHASIFWPRHIAVDAGRRIAPHVRRHLA